MQLVQVKYGSIADLFYHSDLIFSDGDGDSKVIDHIYCLDIEGAIPKGWPLATTSAADPTPLLQNPPFPAAELEPAESTIDHMAVDESGNGGSPSQTALDARPSVVANFPSQANPIIVQDSPFSAPKPNSQLVRTGTTELSGERGSNESPAVGRMDVEGEAQPKIEDKSPMSLPSDSPSSIAVAHAAESDANDMLTARLNAGPGRVSSSVPLAVVSGFSDSDLTDLDNNYNEVYDPPESVPTKRKCSIHDDPDSINRSSESDTDSDQDSSQLDNKHSKSIGPKRKRKTGPRAKCQKRNPAGPASHSNSAFSCDSSHVSYSTLASQ